MVQVKKSRVAKTYGTTAGLLGINFEIVGWPILNDRNALFLSHERYMFGKEDI